MVAKAALWVLQTFREKNYNLVFYYKMSRRGRFFPSLVQVPCCGLLLTSETIKFFLFENIGGLSLYYAIVVSFDRFCSTSLATCVKEFASFTPIETDWCIFATRTMFAIGRQTNGHA